MLENLNYQWFGGPKEWLLILPHATRIIMHFLSTNNLDKSCSGIFHKDFYLTDNILDSLNLKETVDYIRIYQKQQQLLITDLGIAHMGVNHCLNMNESRNIITDVKRWLDFIKPIVREFKPCQCVPSKIGARELIRVLLDQEDVSEPVFKKPKYCM